MQPGLRERLFDDDALRQLHAAADVDDGDVLHDFGSGQARARLAEAEVLLTGWGCPVLTAEVLESAPRLFAVVHAAGSVKHHLTEESWRRGLLVSSAATANAIPVAEFTVAAVLLANKRILPIANRYRRTRAAAGWDQAFPGMGNYRKRVGIVGASRIGRRVIALLQPYDLELVLADPYVDAPEAERLGVTLVDLDELVATSDVVSLHAPALPETRHLIDARRLGLMKPRATLINTARGHLVDTEALTETVLGGHLFAVLDVTSPEVLPADSPLYEHENVLLTPHVAGSLGSELLRMGQSAVQEISRLAAGRPLAYPVLEHELGRTA